MDRPTLEIPGSLCWHPEATLPTLTLCDVSFGARDPSPIMAAQPPIPGRRIGSLPRPGCRLHYEVTGAGPAIVFAHGLGGNQLSWWQQVAHFAPRYTCIAFAHRGFAPSTAIPGGPDPSDYADDLAALIDHLRLADVRIVAQSMGGWSAVEYALRRTGKLKALVLAATTGTIDPGRNCEPAAVAPGGLGARR